MFNVIDDSQQDALMRKAVLQSRASTLNFNEEEPEFASTCMERTYVFFSFETQDKWLVQNPRIFLWAALYQLVNVVMILASIINLVVSTNPLYWNKSSYDSAVIGIFIVDSITVGFFVIDYLIRFTSSPLKLWFLVSLYNIFDLCVIIPYFVQVGLEGSSGTSDASVISVLYVLKLLRIVRVFRLFRLGRYSGMLNSVLNALRKSADALVITLILLSISLIFNATLMFFAEQTRENFNNQTLMWVYTHTGAVSPFQSIYSTFWWCFTTLTYLGYGDEVPQSPLGRAVVLLTVASAIFSFLIPLAVVINRVNVEVSAYQEVKSALRLRELSANEVLLRVFALSQDMNVKMHELRKAQKTLGILLFKLGKSTAKGRNAEMDAHLNLSQGARLFSQSNWDDMNHEEDDDSS